MTNWFKYEFQVKHLKYKDCTPSKFYTSQWGNNVWIFCVFKCFFFLYWLGWIIAALVIYEDLTTYPYFLTNWGVWTIMLYFGVSFGVCCYGVATRKSWQESIPQRSSLNTVTMETNTRNIASEPTLRWFHIINWILHTVALDIAIVITVLFWVLLSTGSENFLSINDHAINLVSMLLDMLVINIPERYLHVIHSFTYALVYIIFLLILHGTGTTSSVYSILDWAEKPGQTAGLCVGVAVSAIIVRAVSFGLFRLRLFIASRTVDRHTRSASGQEESFKMRSDLGADNRAYVPA